MINIDDYRVIDLSQGIIPGELKTNGNYLFGTVNNNRPLEIREFKAWNARMHKIEGQTHMGTHVECPRKYDEEGQDFGIIPVTSFMGSAVACNFQNKKSGDRITSDDFRYCGVTTGDIVLAWGSSSVPEEQAYISDEAINWLMRIKIKMFGCENIGHADPGTPYGIGDSDHKLLQSGIIFIDGLQGLHKIKKKRVFFIALPVRISRITASWTRAVALEEK